MMLPGEQGLHLWVTFLGYIFGLNFRVTSLGYISGYISGLNFWAKFLAWFTLCFKPLGYTFGVTLLG